VLGAEVNNESLNITWDCWKPLLHDESTTPSRGMLLKEVIQDSRIKSVQLKETEGTGYPNLILSNIWDENFLIEFVTLPSNHQLAAHALKLY
jgi:hypothetical protein